MTFRTSTVCFHLIKTIHTRCQSPSSSLSPFESTKILSNHFKLGRISHAEKLFDEMPDRGVISWSIMIHGYAKHGYHDKSKQLFFHMRILGLVPNSFTMVGVLVAVAGSGDLLLGQCVHGLNFKHGLEHDLIVNTALLDAYARCRNVFDSYKVFSGLTNPGLISYNAMITALVYNELFQEAVLLFNQFRKTHLGPGPVTILSLVQACVAVGSRRLSESVHGFVKKTGLCSNLAVKNSVLDMYSTLQDIDAANRVFDSMEIRDAISWTTMMHLFIRLERAPDVLSLFRGMRDDQINPDAVAIINVISGCAMLGDLAKGRQVHALAAVNGYGSEVTLLNSLIAMYSKCRDKHSATVLFNHMKVKTLVSWAAMISGFVHQGYPYEALNIWMKARMENDFCLDEIALIGVLGACADLAEHELCQQLHCHAFMSGLFHHRSVQNSLISTYSKCGNMELALNVFNAMSNLQDVVSWNAIINGYGVNGQGEVAVSFYNAMREVGMDPESMTYSIILSACSHSRLVEKGLEIFKTMKEENRIKPREEHYGCVVDLLARSGSVEDANALVSKCLEGVGKNIWRALLNGCLLHGGVELVELAARRLFEQDEKEPDQVVLLSNVYASVGRFKDAEVLRSSLMEKGSGKSPAISSINGLQCGCG